MFGISNCSHSPRRVLVPMVLGLLLGNATVGAEETDFAGLIRGKTPDRSVYRPPTIAAAVQVAEAGEFDLDEPSPAMVRGVAYSESELPEVPEIAPSRREWVVEEGVEDWPMAQPWPHAGSPIPGRRHAGAINACDAMPCEGGCSGACSAVGCGRASCGSIFGHRGGMNRWFGSVELMLMFREGDNLPILATTSDSATGQGVLPVAPGGTQVLFGGERVLDDMTPGGRVTLGTWLDEQGCVSLVFRGWGAGREGFRFERASDGDRVIARPFLNTDPFGPGGQDSLPIAGNVAGLTNIPGRITIDGSNEVYGADVAFRRLWAEGLGGVVEVLYGYQHMRMRDRLNIASVSFPTPNVVSVEDSFDADNRFHGGQFGLAARYREGCWSFDGLIKVAAGSLRRDALRSGFADLGMGAEPPGLLVGFSNSDPIRNSTFAWVPELNATLGYRYTQHLDLTIGYHLVAMTDALRVSGMIDPDLAVNRNPNSGPADPSPDLRFSTFHVQGIHFGLQYVY